MLPNVPNVPGVPTLVRDASVVFLIPDLLLADGPGIGAGMWRSQWGVFLDGIPVIVCDSVNSLDYKQNWSIADYPIEQGGFESYDKVSTPFESRIRFATGGSTQDRQDFLASVASVAKSLEIYDIVTPEQTYESVNVTHYDYRRTSKEVGLLLVDLWCIEIRLTSSSSFTNTKTPAGATTVNNGPVQTTTPTPNQVSEVSGNVQ